MVSCKASHVRSQTTASLRMQRASRSPSVRSLGRCQNVGLRYLRAYLWEEQQGLCPICAQTITTQTGWEARHIVWRSKGGSASTENQVLLHPNCHKLVHSQGVTVVKPRPARGDREARAG